MIGELIKWAFRAVIILIIFAFLPQGILEKIKQFFNWEIFFNTLKLGFSNLLNFLEETTGIDFAQVPLKLKMIFGIDLMALWLSFKGFLADLFQKLANFLK